MAYTPFKMQGHELPGPNQRTPLTNRQDPTAYAGENFLAHNRDKQRQFYEAHQNQQEQISGTKEGLNAPIDQQNTPVDQPNNQLSTDTTDFSASGATDDATKKKVDVEVTVNGQPV